jgi:hypothetical protein
VGVGLLARNAHSPRTHCALTVNVGLPVWGAWAASVGCDVGCDAWAATWAASVGLRRDVGCNVGCDEGLRRDVGCDAGVGCERGAASVGLRAWASRWEHSEILLPGDDGAHRERGAATCGESSLSMLTNQ